jgi:hypothetical protein
MKLFIQKLVNRNLNSTLLKTMQHTLNTSQYILHLKLHTEFRGLASEGSRTSLYSTSSYNHFY